MKVRFLADANLDYQIVEGVCRRQVWIFSPPTLPVFTGRMTCWFWIAAAQQGVLVTHDKRTMPTAFGEFLLDRHSSGVLIVPAHVSVGPAVEALLLFWSLYETEDWSDRIMYLPI
jgi:hypothetical protein